jgi:hypothetical protein
MGNGAPHNRAIPLTLMVQVVDKFTLAAQKTQIFDPFNRAADISIGTLDIVPPLLHGNFAAILSLSGSNAIKLCRKIGLTA